MIVLTLMQDFFKITFQWDDDDDGVQYKYILTSSIEVKEESDFKLYMLRIVNQLGSVHLNITLIPQGKMSYCVLVWKLLF
jgi:hypothetical protein